MNSRNIILSIAVFTIVTIPFWSFVPGINYLLEIATAVFVLITVIERQTWYIVGASVAALILGTVIGELRIPFLFYLPMLSRIVLPPMIVGLLINNGKKAGVAFAVGAIVLSVIVSAMYLQIGSELQKGVDELGKYVDSALIDPMAQEGYSTDKINDLKDNVAYMVAILKRLLPGMLVLSSLAQLFVSFVLIEFYYIRRDSYFPGFGAFIFWKIPEYLLYILGVALILRLLTNGNMQIAADNILLVLSVAFSVCGLSLIEYTLRKLRLPLFMKIVFYIGMFIMQLPGFIIAAIAGVFDSYFDFRKVRAHTLG